MLYFSLLLHKNNHVIVAMSAPTVQQRQSQSEATVIYNDYICDYKSLLSAKAKN